MKKILMNMLMVGVAFADPFQPVSISSQKMVANDLVASSDTQHLLENSTSQGSSSSADTKISGFSLPKILEYAQAANLAYSLKAGEKAKHDFKAVYALKSINDSLVFGDNFGFIGETKDGTFVLSFAGTTSSKNLATDAHCNWALDHKNGGMYHNGIMNAFRSLEAQIMETFAKLATAHSIDLKTIVAQTTITGHSLGGGMAIIAADVLTRQGYAPKGVIGFAAPRVMDMITAKEYNQSMKDSTLIIKQFTDPVPIMSPFFMGSKQVGHQVVLPFSFEKLRHTLGGYIDALEHMRNNNGKILVNRMSLGGLREKSAEWTFEHDKTKDGQFSTVVKSVFTLAHRTFHGLVLDTKEGVQNVYAHKNEL
ncbi:MAG: lipase family protein, partial [Alphaproteobacteria bacterium]|nr:lipase family protein [Alphaproteobacteria bacterium]